MASILFRGGLAPAIGILGGGELGGEGVREGATGNESRSGVGNKRGFKEKANELKSAGAPLCAGVVKLGVGKSSAVLGLCQGTASRGEGSDKDFSLQSQTRRGKLSRNTPEIQETGNL
jgi:hypothetical protein